MNPVSTCAQRCSCFRPFSSSFDCDQWFLSHIYIVSIFLFVHFVTLCETLKVAFLRVKSATNNVLTLIFTLNSNDGSYFISEMPTPYYEIRYKVFISQFPRFGRRESFSRYLSGCLFYITAIFKNFKSGMFEFLSGLEDFICVKF